MLECLPHRTSFLLQVYLTKHYKNRRKGDPEFVLDFEEIYVVDSKTKSITRAKVLVKNCLLILSLVAFEIFSAGCCNYLSSIVFFLSLEYRLPLLFYCLTISLLMLDIIFMEVHFCLNLMFLHIALES